MQSKIALLANLAFGQTVPTTTIPTVGISRVTTADFKAAQGMRCTIKLIGCAERSADGSSVAVYVSPMLVPLTSPLASAKGAGNMVVLNSSNNDQSILAGPGAGRYPTGKSKSAPLGPSTRLKIKVLPRISTFWGVSAPLNRVCCAPCVPSSMPYAPFPQPTVSSPICFALLKDRYVATHSASLYPPTFRSLI